MKGEDNIFRGQLWTAKKALKISKLTTEDYTTVLPCDNHECLLLVQIHSKLCSVSQNG